MSFPTPPTDSSHVGTVSTAIPTCHLVLWDSCLPSSQVAHQIQGWGHSIPSFPNGLFVAFSSSPPHTGQWTHLLCGTIHSSRQVHRWSGPICCEDSPAHLGNSTLSPSAGLGSSNSEASSLPMPGAEHTSNANSASPVPLVEVSRVLAQHHLTKFRRGGP